MRKRLYILALALTCTYVTVEAQDSTRFYHEAYATIDSMLTSKSSLNFKKAVFATENAYLDGQLNYGIVNNDIEILKKLTKALMAANSIIYNETDKKDVETHAAIFKLLTDTIPIILDSTHILYHIPYTYDFNDMWGQKDWTKMFVSKLLASGNGNCHSLPYLYKILAEEFQIPAYLSFAPNHVYIKIHCKKIGWYNTELTSATFPIDAWIIASGYVHLDAVRNGLYMDTLSLQQSVAYCLLDLAQGYQHRFNNDNPDFVIKCCETVLKYNPTNVNAMLTKAEIQKRFIDTSMKSHNTKSPQELFTDNSLKVMYADMEQTYMRLHQLGYRRMPKEMYLEWIGLLKSEPEKYINKNVIRKFGN